METGFEAILMGVDLGSLWFPCVLFPGFDWKDPLSAFLCWPLTCYWITGLDALKLYWIPRESWNGGSSLGCCAHGGGWCCIFDVPLKLQGAIVCWEGLLSRVLVVIYVVQAFGEEEKTVSLGTSCCILLRYVALLWED